MANDKLEDLYKSFLASNKQAFDLEEFNAAYHALMAALHCAASLEDSFKLAAVADIAAAELREIDSRHPDYEHSSQSSALRSHPNIFSTLTQEAKAKITILETRKLLEKT